MTTATAAIGDDDYDDDDDDDFIDNNNLDTAGNDANNDDLGHFISPVYGAARNCNQNKSRWKRMGVYVCGEEGGRWHARSKRLINNSSYQFGFIENNQMEKKK